MMYQSKNSLILFRPLYFDAVPSFIGLTFDIVNCFLFHCLIANLSVLYSVFRALSFSG